MQRLKSFSKIGPEWSCLWAGSPAAESCPQTITSSTVLGQFPLSHTYSQVIKHPPGGDGSASASYPACEQLASHSHSTLVQSQCKAWGWEEDSWGAQWGRGAFPQWTYLNPQLPGGKRRQRRPGLKAGANKKPKQVRARAGQQVPCQKARLPLNQQVLNTGSTASHCESLA